MDILCTEGRSGTHQAKCCSAIHHMQLINLKSFEENYMIIKIWWKKWCTGIILYCTCIYTLYNFLLQNVSLVDNCVTTDGRIPANNRFPCTMYQTENITFASLFNDGFKSQSGSPEPSFSSNIMPMYQGFKSGIWTYLWRIISDFAGQPGDLSVTLGPAFDYNQDGLYEGIIDQTK